MKWKTVILAGALLTLACVTAMFLSSRPSAWPVTISFLGYTNQPAGSEAAAAVSNERQALFRLTNNTASRLAFRTDVDASGVGSNDVTSLASASGDLAGHSAYTIPVVTPGDTHGWRFLVVTSVSGPRASWQQRIRMLLGRAGIHPPFLASDRTYPQFTNVWTTR